MFGPYSSVLKGCHHWKLHNLNKSGWHAVTIGAMLIVLFAGATLPTIALVYLIGQVLAYFTRILLAYKVCEGLKVRSSFISKKNDKENLCLWRQNAYPGNIKAFDEPNN